MKPANRNLGIILVAIAQFLVSSLSLIAGILLLLLITGAVEVFDESLTNLSLSIKGLILLGLAISLFGLIVTYGLWTLKRWGWIGSIMFQTLCIINNGLGLLAGQSISPGTYFAAALCTSLIGDLCLPSIQDVFAVDTVANVPD